MECPKCGYTNPDTAMNCEKCRTNLEWAREHLDRRQRIEAKKEVQERRKPSMAENYQVVAILGVVLLMASAYFIIAWGWEASACYSVPCMLVGILMVVWVLNALTSPVSSYNVFRRSSTTVQAKVLRRHTER